MTDCPLRPQSFLILHPPRPQTLTSPLSPPLVAGPVSPQVFWLLALFPTPTAVTLVGSLSHDCWRAPWPPPCLRLSLPPLQPVSRCRRDTSGLETHGGSLSHCQSLTFLAGPLSPRITCPNLSAFAQPFFILLTLNQPMSLLNWLNFFFFPFLPCLFSCFCLGCPLSHLHWSFIEPSLIHPCPGKEVIPSPKLLYHLNHFPEIIIVQKKCWLWSKTDLVLNLYAATY